jgi:hypothetical protein
MCTVLLPPGVNPIAVKYVYHINFCIVMYVPFSVFCVLFVCKCVLYYCHRVSTQLQFNIYHHIIYTSNNNNNNKLERIFILTIQCHKRQDAGLTFTSSAL